MPLHQAPAQVRRTTRPVAETMRSPGSPSANEIPFDYVARFTLAGRRGNRIQDVINISVEGAFVAIAIGYSFFPVALPPIQPPVEQSPGLEAALFTPSPNSTLDWIISNLIEPSLDPRALVRCWAIKLCGIDFRYSIVDSGSGRELQNQPIHNIAGLGESNGDRPFRPFAKPMMFMPRSTIRIEIEEISEGLLYTGAELYIVLHGYKSLGYGSALS
jgi:hypothetical protein